MIYDNHAEFTGISYYCIPVEHYNTVFQLYDIYETWEVNIKDIFDNILVWTGNFSDLPLKYAVSKFEGAKVYSDDCEIDIFINESEVIE